MREKLIKLLCQAHNLATDASAFGFGDISYAQQLEMEADHLIANGVTVQQWISVKDRLPELIPCSAGTAYSEAVIVWTDNRKAMIAVWDGIDFLCAADYWEAWGEEITHWMPLPDPPKGE